MKPRNLTTVTGASLASVESSADKELKKAQAVAALWSAFEGMAEDSELGQAVVSKMKELLA